MRPLSFFQKFIGTVFLMFLLFAFVQIYSMKVDSTSPVEDLGFSPPNERNLASASKAESRSGASSNDLPPYPNVTLKDKYPEEWYRQQPPVVAVMWDGGTPFGWGDGDVLPMPNYAGYTIVKEPCPVKCEWTQDRTRVNQAEAVLFDVCGTGPHEFRDVPVYFPPKQEGQLWLWYAYEQMYYFPMLQQQEYLDLFDGHISYHHDSLVHITYVCPWGGVSDFLAPPPPKSRDKLAVFVTSNCYGPGGARERTEYVKEMMRYMPIDSVGMCLNNKPSPINRANKGPGWSNGNEQLEKIRFVSQYKFLLAFENGANVTDYVTEKMVDALLAGTVPVYRGAPNIEQWAPGDHSIINAHDFASPRELAEYLLYLNEHDDLYQEYFAWKRRGLRPHFQELYQSCLFYAECRLCKRLAEMRAEAGRPSRHDAPPLRAFALEFNRLDRRLPWRGDDAACTPTHPALDLRKDYTLSAWIQPNLLGDGRIIDKNRAGDFDGYLFDVLKTGPAEGVLRLCAAQNCFGSQRHIRVGIWYHVAAVFRAGALQNQIELYINGKLDSIHQTPYDTQTNQHQLCVGKAATGASSWRGRHIATCFDGIIDEVSIWNRPLDEAEIFRMRFQHLTGREQNLVAYWDFDEGEGTTAYDKGPNQLHLQLYGQPMWILAISKPLNDVSNLEMSSRV